MKFYPYKRGGGEVLAILKGEVKKVSTLYKKGGGGGKVLPSRRGGAKSFGPAIFPFCSPPPPHNDQSFRGLFSEMLKIKKM